MTADQPPGAPGSPATPEAILGTIDLSGGPEETPVATVGRVIGGFVLMIIGGVLALGFLGLYIGGDFVPGFSDWHEILGDGLLYAAIIAFVIAVTGFELMRRSRKKRRAAAAADAADIVGKLANAGVYDGTATPGTIAAAMGEQPEVLESPTATKPPVAGPTIL